MRYDLGNTDVLGGSLDHLRLVKAYAYLYLDVQSRPSLPKHLAERRWAYNLPLHLRNCGGLRFAASCSSLRAQIKQAWVRVVAIIVFLRETMNLHRDFSYLVFSEMILNIGNRRSF